MEIPSGLPNNYISVTTDVVTAITAAGSVFSVTGLPINDNLVLYYPPTVGNKTLTPTLSLGKATGHFTVDGNGTLATTVWYHDVGNDNWYSANVTMTGAVVHATFQPVVNAEPGVDLVFESELYASEGEIISVTGGSESSVDGGVTWSTANKVYVHGNTRVRKTLVIANTFDTEFTDTVVVNGRVFDIAAYTRMAVAPKLPADASFNVLENTTGVSTINVVEGEKTISYSLIGNDAPLFSIGNLTGLLEFKTAPNFESPDDDGTDNQYNLTVVANNGDSTDQMLVTINVVDVLEATPAPFTFNAVIDATPDTVYSPSTEITGIDPGANVTVANGETSNDNGVTWSIVDKPFVEGDTFVRPILTSSNDWETEVTVIVNVNGQTALFSITTMEEPFFPVEMGPTRNLTINENGTVVGTAVTALSGTGPVTYSLSGDDAGLLSINPLTGALSFLAAPDFELPSDANADNVYSVIVTGSNNADNGTSSDNVVVNITVLNVLANVTALDPLAITLNELTNKMWTTDSAFVADLSGVVAATGSVSVVSYYDVVKDIVALRNSNLRITSVTNVAGGTASVTFAGKFIRAKLDEGETTMTFNVNLTDDSLNPYIVPFTINFS